MTSKEALKQLKDNAEDLKCEWELERLNIIENDLNILQILKQKKVNLHIITHSTSLLDYNNKWGFISENLTNKEYTIVKEWLDNYE